MTESDLDKFEEWLVNGYPTLNGFALNKFRQMRADARRRAQFEALSPTRDFRDHSQPRAALQRWGYGESS